MSDTFTEIRSDLIAEQAALDKIVAGLPDDRWELDTPSPGWTVADQIGHLTYFDAAAALAIRDPEGFATHLSDFMSVLKGETDGDTYTLGAYRAMSPSELLSTWRTNRADLAELSADMEGGERVSWYGPSMGAKSFLTARLMEAWAHGQDIADALGVDREPTDRLKHIAQLGYLTRGWTFINRGLEAPTKPMRVDLEAPSGDEWSYGPEEAGESVTGDALDFCLVVTQRRHIDDTELITSGDHAQQWMQWAQAFAGPPSNGPKPSA